MCGCLNFFGHGSTTADKSQPILMLVIGAADKEKLALYIYLYILFMAVGYQSTLVLAGSGGLWLSGQRHWPWPGLMQRCVWLSCGMEGGAVANRLQRRTSDQTVLGSNPAVAAALSPWTRLFTPIVPRRSLRISFY